MRKKIRRILLKILKPVHTTTPFFLLGGRNKDLAVYLSQIPSETSLNERIFLYWLTREWVKSGLIVELGPFLGGTTRALAKGIADNPIGGKRLVTIDQFDNYYGADSFIKMGVRIPDQVDQSQPVKFQEIFNGYHDKEAYNSYIETYCLKVADLPSESTDYTGLTRGEDISVLFIDGCKSWYSMIDFIGNLCEHTKPGAYYVFQDYGRFTCFWIPAFTEVFKDHLEFIGSVDSTHAFKLIKPLTKTLIHERFKPTPGEMNELEMERLFSDMIGRVSKDNDHLAIVNLTIQNAAYLAYVGKKEKARAILMELDARPFVKGRLKKLVTEASVSPTYTPEGPVTL